MGKRHSEAECVPFLARGHRSNFINIFYALARTLERNMYLFTFVELPIQHHIILISLLSSVGINEPVLSVLLQQFVVKVSVHLDCREQIR